MTFALGRKGPSRQLLPVNLQSMDSRLLTFAAQRRDPTGDEQCNNQAPTRFAFTSFRVSGRNAGIAALVMTSHRWLTLWPLYRSFPSHSWLRHWHILIILGHFSVDFSIVLSGFCLMLPVVHSHQLNGGAWKFYKKRFRWIVPPSWVVLMFSSALLFSVLSHNGLLGQCDAAARHPAAHYQSCFLVHCG